jgi:hypothetical protein
MSAKSRKGKSRPALPSYVVKLRLMRRAGILADGVHHIDVAHDGWCPKLHGGACGCDALLHITRSYGVPQAAVSQEG